MEHSIGVLRTAVEKAKMGRQEKLDALRKLAEQGEAMMRRSE